MSDRPIKRAPIKVEFWHSEEYKTRTGKRAFRAPKLVTATLDRRSLNGIYYDTWEEVFENEEGKGVLVRIDGTGEKVRLDLWQLRPAGMAEREAASDA